MRLRYLIRCALLMLGFAFTTLGLMSWQAQQFSFEGFWPDNGELELHPLHLMILGIAMIPPAIWEIFFLDLKRRGVATIIDKNAGSHDARSYNAEHSNSEENAERAREPR